MKISELQYTWENFLRERDDKNKKKLVEHYFPFVKKVAQKLSYKLNNVVTVDELSSHGVDGLYRAIERYDPDRGNKFETYAYTRVRGSMLDELRKQDWIPRSVRIRQTEIEKTKQKIQSDTCTKAQITDILDELDIKKSKYFSHVNNFKPRAVSSIDACSNADIDDSDNKKDFNQYLVSKNNVSVDSSLIRREFLSKLIGKRCGDLDKKIVYYYYYECLTMSEIASRLQITESRVSQLHQKILKRLRKGIKVNPKYFSDDIFDTIDACNDTGSLFN